MSNNKKDKSKYGLLNNILYLFKEEFAIFPQVKWLIPIYIIAECAFPLIGTIIPALAVRLIMKKVVASQFLLAMGGLLLVYTLIHYVGLYSDRWISQYHTWIRCNEFGEKLFNKSVSADYENIEPHKMQLMMEKACNALASNWIGVEIIYKRTPTMILNIIGMLGYGVAILTLDIRILIILLFMSISNVILNHYARSYMEGAREEENKLNHSISYLYFKSTSLENAKDVRIYQMEKWFSGVFQSCIQKLTNLRTKVEKRWYLPVASDTVFSAIRDFAAYLILLKQVIEGSISLAEFTFFIGLVAGFSNWLFGFVNALAEVKTGSILVNDLRAMLDYPDNFKREEGLAIPEDTKYPLTIEFHDVCFRYEDTKEDCISHMNLTIRAGEKIALVGHNGAGKSTIVKLLCGFYQPTSGEILVGGRSISEYNIDEYYKLIGAVFQEIRPLSFTIAQNISGKGIEDTDMDRVRHCLEEAGLWDKIESLDKKEMTYLTRIFEDSGIQLSGGETQKLMLARAIYKNAPIMILDEPTAALDPIAESHMYEEYNRQTRNKTSIFISHRLASTRFCDRIIYLEDGKIKEIGTHEELMNQNGEYAKVYEVQSHYYKEKQDEPCDLENNIEMILEGRD